MCIRSTENLSEGIALRISIIIENTNKLTLKRLFRKRICPNLTISVCYHVYGPHNLYKVTCKKVYQKGTNVQLKRVMN